MRSIDIPVLAALEPWSEVDGTPALRISIKGGGGGGDDVSQEAYVSIPLHLSVHPIAHSYHVKDNGAAARVHRSVAPRKHDVRPTPGDFSWSHSLVRGGSINQMKH